MRFTTYQRERECARETGTPKLAEIGAASTKEVEPLAACLGSTGTIAVPLGGPISPTACASVAPPPNPKTPCPTRETIERLFALFGTIIPAYSGEDLIHRRTSYFYRKNAIAWARMVREDWPTPSMPDLCARFAKHYLAKYRERKRQGPALPAPNP